MLLAIISGSAGPYQGTWQRNEGGGGSASKTTTWEGGHREVGVARWTGKIKPRTSIGHARITYVGKYQSRMVYKADPMCLGRVGVSNATLSTLDFFPTFLSLAGLALPTDRIFDGIDVSAVLLVRTAVELQPPQRAYSIFYGCVYR